MSKDKIKLLKIKQKELSRLIEKYESECSDIAPPIKNIDGMPFANTNDVSSPVELKAMRLTETYSAIQSKRNEIKSLLSGLWNMNSPEAIDFILYRYLACYSYETIKDKMNCKKSADNIRKICDYTLNTM